MKVIAHTIIENGEATCAICYPNYKSKLDSATDDELLERIIAKDIPADAQHVTIIDHTELPYSGWNDATKTRTVAMRGSWVNPPDATSPPVVDMAKARQAKMDLEWRPRRNKLLSELDVEYQRADEQADNSRKAAIARDKAKLRTMPEDFITAAQSITDAEELDNFDPVIEIIVSMESV